MWHRWVDCWTAEPVPPAQSLTVERPRRFFEEFMCAPDGGQPLIITGVLVLSAEQLSLRNVSLHRLPTIRHCCSHAGGMDSWPARQRWQDLDYLRAAAGARTVPVEVRTCLQFLRCLLL